jgi:hypothetical protein
MHRGVQDFMRVVLTQGEALGIRPNGPCPAAALSQLEHQIGSPLPADLRFALSKFNGATLPTGTLLGVGAPVGDTTEAALKSLAEHLGRSFLDPELPLPFHRNDEGALLAFDRSAGPVADTWPIIDFFPETGEVRLVYRTFDGWCRTMVAEWTSPDFFDDFTLDKYLRAGERHASIESDVASAHATVAHALKRAGRPEEALASYLRAARCVPSLPWCDWEALKLAALLRNRDAGVEAATRLSARAPAERWAQRETTPGRVADVLGTVAFGADDLTTCTRLLDQLAAQSTDAEDKEQVAAVRHALVNRLGLPETRASRGSMVPAVASLSQWWDATRQAYFQGQVRDEDLLLDPSFAPLRASYDFAELLRIRRDF